MEWEAVGIVIASHPFGEGDAVVTLLTGAFGAHRGLARGGRSRAGRSTWEIGNILSARWVGRLADQLGTFSAEVLQFPSACLFDKPLQMASLASVCAVAVGSMPEHVMHPRTYDGLVDLLAGFLDGGDTTPSVVRWEATLLAELGYGLDLTRCAVTGVTSGLTYVSPRSGRAVSEAGAGAWRERLLRLPPFMLDVDPGRVTAPDCQDGLELTGYFLARDAFGSHHQGLPKPRLRLVDMVARRVGSSRCDLA